MKCLSCGNEIPSTAAHCVYCGVSTSSPGSQAQQSYSLGSLNNATPAPRLKRFINLVVDGILVNIIATLLGAAGLRYIIGEYGFWTAWMINWLVIPFAYYFVTELAWSKSPAKFLTKTHVITDKGFKLTASQVAIRTLVRWIPFEALSFLFSHRPVGWHDRFAHTKVVDD